MWRIESVENLCSTASSPTAELGFFLFSGVFAYQNTYYEIHMGRHATFRLKWNEIRAAQAYDIVRKEHKRRASITVKTSYNFTYSCKYNSFLISFHTRKVLHMPVSYGILPQVQPSSHSPVGDCTTRTSLSCRALHLEPK